MASDFEKLSGGGASQKEYIDAAAEMHRIRDQVHQTRRPGSPQSAGISATDPVVDYGEIHGKIREVSERWNVRELPFESPTPVIGPLLAAIRSAVNSIAAKWHVRRILLQQNAFNLSVYQLLQSLAGEMEKQAELSASLSRQVHQHAEWQDQQETWNTQRQDRWERGQREILRQAQLLLQQQIDVLVGARRFAERSSEETADAAQGMSSPSVRDEAVWDYRAFNEVFTGSEHVIKALYRQYVPLFTGRQNILDAGCGQGHFLELLAEAGLEGYGVDREETMGALCESKGLRVVRDDVLAHLAGVPAESLGGIFAGHLIEHLSPRAVQRFLATAHRALQPGGVLVCETPNTLCLFVMANTFYRDPTHQRPLHPETYQFLATLVGFANIQLRYSLPVPSSYTAEPLNVPAEADARVRYLVMAGNERLRRINEQLFGAQNVALVGYKPAITDAQRIA